MAPRKRPRRDVASSEIDAQRLSWLERMSPKALLAHVQKILDQRKAS